MPPTIPVQGKVTYLDKPVTAGTVVFSPVDPAKARPAMGELNSNGEFRMTTFARDDGVQPGDYRLAIFPPDDPADSPTTKAAGKKVPPMRLQYPPLYRDPVTSGLTESIPAGSGKIFRELKLTGSLP